LLTEPLIHLLRNAVDHGVEEQKSRKAGGKTAVSRIDLRAYHSGGSVCIEVADNGRGLDAEAILGRAREMGLVGPSDRPSERDVFALVFTPGFSTAKKVTEVSGRGVGMDVVKRAVEGLRGTVEIHSTPGEGTRFTLRLPLTLAIIDGMVLRVAGEHFILPTLSIRRSVRPEPDEVATVLGRGEMLSMPNGLVPLVRLDRLFGCEGESCPPSEGIVVIVGENGQSAGLVASELVGQQQTVIKPLGEGLAETPGVSGGAIMPDGTVGLILDVSGLIRLAHASVDERPETSTTREVARCESSDADPKKREGGE
jgi:two-component system chemotaxis sensor kinase CheA